MTTIRKATTNALRMYGINADSDIYESIQTDEEIANFYHYLLNKYGHRTAVTNIIFRMMEISLNKRLFHLNKI